jgi:hypothetical protein
MTDSVAPGDNKAENLMGTARIRKTVIGAAIVLAICAGLIWLTEPYFRLDRNWSRDRTCVNLRRLEVALNNLAKRHIDKVSQCNSVKELVALCIATGELEVSQDRRAEYERDGWEHAYSWNKEQTDGNVSIRIVSTGSREDVIELAITMWNDGRIKTSMIGCKGEGAP